jgi:hypothetical protein
MFVVPGTSASAFGHESGTSNDSFSDVGAST